MRLDTVMVSSLFLCNFEYALRVLVLLAMRGSRDRMVVLAIATFTAIPTALRTRIILDMQTQFIQLEVWFILEEYLVPTEICSPGTGGFDANYAWNVDKSGNIPLFSDHGNSYGHTFIRSPAIDTVADSIFYVAIDGGAYISDYISTYSYGSPNTNGSYDAYYVYSSGVVYYGYDLNVGRSYGQSYIIRVRFTARIISVLYMKGAIKYEIYQGHEITRQS